MSKHGQNFNEHRSYSEGFADGRKYEREQMAEHSEVEGLVEEFKQTNIYKTARVSGYGKKMEDWLRTALTTHGAKEYERGRLEEAQACRGSMTDNHPNV